MKVIGMNIGKTQDGISLYDGGCALVEDGLPLVAIAEERITRKKYDGGIKNSLKYCLESTGNQIKDIDLFVFSICCDEPLRIDYVKNILKKNKIKIPEEKIIINESHHLSHACSSYFASPFKEAIVLVVDNEGNILEKKYKKYWKNRLERTSIYVAKGNEITLQKRYHDGFKELGIGAAYNFFTRWLGFRSHQEAGKTMGLASYGKPTFKNVQIFKNHKCLIENKHEKKASAVRELILKQTGIDIGKKRTSVKYPKKIQEDVAYLIQDQVEKELIKLVKETVSETKIKNMCIAGGVGLNCVANYKILKQTGVNLFVQPASGDTGQCLGNAYMGYYIYSKKKKRNQLKTAYLGKEYTKKEISSEINKYNNKITCKIIKDDFLTVAELISKGNIIGWFQGKSEFGPRALGDRSIIADARNKDMKDILNRKIKFREQFRPYAPIVLEEDASKYFDLDRPSPFMLLATKVKKGKDKEITSVTHVDKTARIQTINNNQNPQVYKLLKQFKKITSCSVILNTSFNIAGEPIVESPKDAINCFLSTNLDYLVIGNYLISKKNKKEIL
jgi:carbamoyltransferase